MAVELKPHGVFVITLWPGAVKTEVRSTNDEEVMSTNDEEVRSTDDEEVFLMLSACVCMGNCERIIGVL
jgi:short-subunit dehydrogenase